MTHPFRSAVGLVMVMLATPVGARAAPAAEDAEVFHGWSRDGTWLVYEVHERNELVILYFCALSSERAASWPAAVNELEREERGGMSCAQYMDPNKAPYRWKAQLVLPAPSLRQGGVELLRELVTDGENPGFVLQAGDKRQVCYASGLKETSKVERAWFHPAGHRVAALIDGRFRHCDVALHPIAAKGPRRK